MVNFEFLSKSSKLDLFGLSKILSLDEKTRILFHNTVKFVIIVLGLGLVRGLVGRCALVNFVKKDEFFF